MATTFVFNKANVLQGYVTRICEIYIDDVLLFGTTDDEYFAGHVTANPEKTELGLDEVEYVGHLISSTGTSFTDEKRLQVLDFPLSQRLRRRYYNSSDS